MFVVVVVVVVVIVVVIVVVVVFLFRIGWWYSVITNTVIGSGAACSVVSVYKTLFKIAQ